MNMFCYQCEQTAKGEGCEKIGVCGKQPDVAALQDLLVHALQGLGIVAHEGRKVGVKRADADAFVCEALFSTLTNVDFDPERFKPLIEQAVKYREEVRSEVKAAGGAAEFDAPETNFEPAPSLDGMIRQGEEHGLLNDKETDTDKRSLKHTLLFGLKGISAYADHARILGQTDDSIYAFLHESMAALARTDLSLEDWLSLVLRCGEANLKTMEILDKANTGAYGDPVPTEVPLGPKKGKAILISGHDLKDLEDLLKQTEGKGINIYTHGEMLPTHGYPKLKAYPHFYGHYGTAWQNQHKEFSAFPGAILMTTNCLMRPQEKYRDNLFTTGLVGWPEIKHVKNGDFGPVVEKALEMPGFTEDVQDKTVMVGFGHNAVMSVADKVIDLVKSKKIRHFFLVAGCDGAKPGRNYYTEFVEKVPKDCVVMTLACGKFRFFDKDLGDIEGLPRLLDIGQCNDSYSAIQIAVALSKAFGVGVNELPLSMILSWYEQKAVAILLTLLYLGIQDIRLGPSLPAFTSPNVLQVLVDKFNIKPITTPDEDLKAILG
ncbi:hydroxylamine reductase [Desulfonatronum thiosulfatophilum]|uniref:Hydroxylamine reductase n=2 Tax=Desulfonatronum thiosulfatophilum TaxID=617002 RepID=A0A1G6CJA0_9BACT|nr:hydroxylamine reductase [Desulfonatronum thiosulfatophilum]